MAILSELFDTLLELPGGAIIDAVTDNAVETAESAFERLFAVKTTLRENLVTKTVTVHRADGSTFQRQQQVRADADGNSTDSDNLAELPAEDTRDIEQAVDDAVPADIKAKPGVLERVKDAALTLAAKTYMTMVSWTPAMMQVGEVLGVVFDTPSDMQKLGYNPTMTSGTAQAGVLDPVKNATGISGHIVSKIAATVLAKGLVWAKNKIKSREADEAADAIDRVSEFAAKLLAELHREFEWDKPVPDAATIAKLLRERMSQ